MNTSRAAGPVPDDHALDQHLAGPTAARMLVGARLRRLREARGVTREEAGSTIRGSDSKISRLELGRTGFKLRDVVDLLTLYGVTDEAEREVVLTLATQANAPGWWQHYSDVVPAWLEPYLGLEQAASVIRTYDVQFVPDLLQTPEYARAVMRLYYPGDTEETLERRVEMRMRRQQVLDGDDPPKLWVAIDESALRRPTGGRATLRLQLRRLIEATELPHVTVQVLPFSAGGHPAAGGSFTFLRFPEGGLPDVVYLEQLATAIYLDKPAEVAGYWDVLNRIGVQATQARETPGLLGRILYEV
ncbi:MAG TPA: helix-turn-helix transcriptional regulator [Streptosporangiaceae bacterium]|jgi:transcriptional regulator with XRE-family HTH domain